MSGRAQRGRRTLQKAYMKYLEIFAIGALAAACSSNSPPPAASAASIDEASSTPSSSANFAPASNDGSASAASDVNGANAGVAAHHATAPSTANPAGAQASAMTPPSATNTAPDMTASNAAAMPAQTPPTNAPDNTRVNARDKGGKNLTPMDQGEGTSDLKITQQIRQALMRDGSLSFGAKNVKIITVNGKVTLRGPVKTDAERSAIEAAAKSAAGAGQVDNLLEVKK